MEIVCDTSFLMVLCYEPVKNLDALESKFGKLIWLIHPETVDELTQLENAAGIKRSKIANLSLRIIKNQIEKGDFRYLDRNELQQQQQQQFDKKKCYKTFCRHRFIKSLIPKEKTSGNNRQGFDKESSKKRR